VETFDMIAAERRALADELDGLDDEQWEQQSLCGAWKVRDVAGHLTVPFVSSRGKVFTEIVRNGLSFNKANAALAKAQATKPTAEIVGNLRANAEHRFTPPFHGPAAPLTDIVVHGQDIRRPLGIAHTFDHDVLRQTLDFVTGGKATGFVPARRTHGLRFEATDFDWSRGEGPLVRGPGEAILMAVTGRAVALDDLDGDGVAVLRDRIA
jgi:uncharacterized protein (TIGR03083 family)